MTCSTCSVEVDVGMGLQDIPGAGYLDDGDVCPDCHPDPHGDECLCVKCLPEGWT